MIFSHHAEQDMHAGTIVVPVKMQPITLRWDLGLLHRRELMLGTSSCGGRPMALVERPQQGGPSNCFINGCGRPINICLLGICAYTLGILILSV